MSLWSRVLSELRKQTTHATFEAWFADTRASEHNGVLKINVPSTFAKEWLQDRYLAQIQRIVHHITGRRLQVRFAVQTPTDIHPLTAVELVEYDPTKRGFVQTSNYAWRFWQPYLGGKAFRLWGAIRSFAYEASHTGWWPSIRALAEICFRGDKSQVIGRNRKRTRKREDGSEYEITEWAPGTLEILEQEKIVWYKRVKARHGKLVYERYIFRVLDSLPLLTPTQVQSLSPYLQTKHEKFVRKCAIDYEEWQQLSFPTLTGSG
jgi:hypothetical protein